MTHIRRTLCGLETRISILRKRHSVRSIPPAAARWCTFWTATVRSRVAEGGLLSRGCRPLACAERRRIPAALALARPSTIFNRSSPPKSPPILSRPPPRSVLRLQPTRVAKPSEAVHPELVAPGMMAARKKKKKPPALRRLVAFLRRPISPKT